MASLVGAGAASATPGLPTIDIAEKPHRGHGHDHGPGKWGHGPVWAKGGWNPGIDACVSATDPYGAVSGYVCLR